MTATILTWDFLHPGRLWWLIALVALVGAYVFGLVRRRRRAIRFSNVSLLDKVAPRRSGWARTDKPGGRAWDWQWGFSGGT